MTTPAYVELHCHSYYSLLDGASSPEALVERAVSLGYPALALTDHDGLYGAVRFWRAARERGLKPIIGAEVSLANACPELAEGTSPKPSGGTCPEPVKGASPEADVPSVVEGARPELVEGGRHLTLLAETQRGYANLCRILSAGQLAGQKGQPRLTLDTLAGHAQGLICLSGCRQGAVPRALLAGDGVTARSAAVQLRDIFGPGRFWIEVQRHLLPTDARLAAALVSLARELDTGLVATNDVHYAGRPGQRLHDVLTCIRYHATLPQALGAGLLHPNSERFLKSPQAMAALFGSPGHGLSQALRNTLHIAERCDVSLDFSAQRLPAFPVPEGHTTGSYLRCLCEEGLGRRFSPVAPRARVQMDHELAVIKGMGLAGYFLVVWDIVRFARQQGIRCQGRGSAANSLVAYLLEITQVDPLRHNLLFERFLSEGGQSGPGTMPDIDVDFAADRREEVVQYVYERYGEEHVGMVCNVVTYRARSALRETAKALAFPADVIDHAAKSLDTRSAEAVAEAIESTLPDGISLPWQVLADLLKEMDGVPRHLSIHVGGMLITAAPLVEVVPLERATMPGRVVVQWDKDGVEDAGLIKIDLLSLRTLGAVEEARAHILAWRGLDLEPADLPLDDPAVYDLLQRADTVGCFQVESRAQAQMLPKLLPRRFEDIVVGVALIRPGPIQGGMVHPYLRRRQGLEPVAYAHPALEPALAETLGVIVFQEQVLRVAMAVARFAPAEADHLRRAMSRSRSKEAMAALRQRFVVGAQANGLDEDAAGEIWQQLKGFAGFGFCKSHAAAFALVAYQTLYLKAHYPAEFYCALLNHQPLGFYPPEVLAGDARRHGVPILQPDANRSQAACSLERACPRGQVGPGGQVAIRLGLGYVRGLGEAWQERIVERRGGEPYRDLVDFCRRTRLPRAVVENLIRAGALDDLGSRRTQGHSQQMGDGLLTDASRPEPGRLEPGSASVRDLAGTQGSRRIQSSRRTQSSQRMQGDDDRTRRDLLWELGGLVYHEEGLDIEVPVAPVALPALGRAERLAWEYELMGMAPGEHLMGLYREALRAAGVLSSAQLAGRRNGERVRVAGWAVVRQRPPTAKGHLFITLEDEEGLANLIVRPGVYEQYRDVLRNAPLLWIEGRLQREGHAISVLVYRAAALGSPRI